jgi:hypothetical protein
MIEDGAAMTSSLVMNFGTNFASCVFDDFQGQTWS